MHLCDYYNVNRHASQGSHSVNRVKMPLHWNVRIFVVLNVLILLYRKSRMQKQRKQDRENRKGEPHHKFWVMGRELVGVWQHHTAPGNVNKGMNWSSCFSDYFPLFVWTAFPEKHKSIYQLIQCCLSAPWSPRALWDQGNRVQAGTRVLWRDSLSSPLPGEIKWAEKTKSKSTNLSSARRVAR